MSARRSRDLSGLAFATVSLVATIAAADGNDAKVRFDVPPDVLDLQVEVDGRLVYRAEEGKTYSIDAGPHHVTASGARGAVRVGLDEDFVVAPDEVRTVFLGRMTPQEGVCSCAPMTCLREARTEAEARRCTETGRVRGGCGGCGTSSRDPAGIAWLSPLVLLGWLARRGRRARSR